ncbi:MAG: VWA domain-containing protein [Hyphomicrobiales bacterium]|nr:VWA domain-containing protein [Hyphomicrobiales bacterium]
MTTDRKTPAERKPQDVAARSNGAEIDAFLKQAQAIAPASVAGRGRLIFALDATMSRQPTWDRAIALQGEMFEVAEAIGGLDIQLLYYRGLGECRASRWVSDGRGLSTIMSGIGCRGGETQIGKVLAHARCESERQKVQAMVFIGDALEEDADRLAVKAGELALIGLPVFVFQEGRDRVVEAAFKEIARLTGGAWCRFDASAADELRALLRAAAVYAAGGLKALESRAGSIGRPARLLLEQMR